MSSAGSLFSGIGGLDISVSRALGAEPLWMCESDKHARAVLARHYPNVPILPDIRELDDGTPPVENLHGGYPCQPFSLIGRRQGEDDPRHLWPEFARLIRLLRPKRVILENVSNHLVLGFDSVLGALSEMGYDTRWGSVRASDAGAPHRRERVFAIATDSDLQHGRPGGWGVLTEGVGRENGGTKTYTEAPPAAWGEYQPVISRWESIVGRQAPFPATDSGALSAEFGEWFMGFPAGWTEGSSRTQRLRILGNAVVPQQGELALRLLSA